MSDFGCKIVMESLHGRSHCEVCGREWEALTPRGSANHCARELGSLVETLRSQLSEARGLLEQCANRFERCCIHSGSDKEFAAHAVEDYRAFLAKSPQPTGEGR